MGLQKVALQHSNTTIIKKPSDSLPKKHPVPKSITNYISLCAELTTVASVAGALAIPFMPLAAAAAVATTAVCLVKTALYDAKKEPILAAIAADKDRAAQARITREEKAAIESSRQQIILIQKEATAKAALEKKEVEARIAQEKKEVEARIAREEKETEAKIKSSTSIKLTCVTVALTINTYICYKINQICLSNRATCMETEGLSKLSLVSTGISLISLIKCNFFKA